MTKQWHNNKGTYNCQDIDSTFIGDTVMYWHNDECLLNKVQAKGAINLNGTLCPCIIIDDVYITHLV